MDRRQLISQVRAAEELQRREIIRRCEIDPWFWLTAQTKTFDEQAREKGVEAYKPFPETAYLKLVLAILLGGEEAAIAAANADGSDEFKADAAYLVAQGHLSNPGKYKPEPHTAVPKSREMMISWIACGLLTWDAQFHERTRWVIQTKKEQTAEELLAYCKCLYAQQPDWMKDRYLLAGGKKDTEGGQQSKLLQLWGHKSRIIGLPQGADQVRQAHPSGILFDEACYIEDYEASLAAAGAACRRIISISSAKPGNYFEQVVAA